MLVERGSALTSGLRDLPLVLVAAAVAASMPSIVWAATGAGFISDDWFISSRFRRLGVLDAMWEHAFVTPARPVVALYNAAIYAGVGERPVVQALIMAAINMALVVALWLLGTHLLPRRLLAPAVLAYALLPNRAATRLWFAAGPPALSLTFAALGILMLIRRRTFVSGALLVVSCLLYEASIVFAFVVAAAWGAQALADRWRQVVIALTPAAIAAVLSYLRSPKRTGSGGPAPFENALTLLPAQFGNGLWSAPAISNLLGRGLLIFVVIAFATQAFPSFRSDRMQWRWAFIGFVLVIASALPLFVAGAPFATVGVFDRNNLVPGVGAAIVLSSAWSLLHERWRPVAQIAGVATLLLFFLLSMQDVSRWTAAVRDGDRALQSVVAALTDSEVESGELVIVAPPQPGDDRAVSAFIYSEDLRTAVEARTGRLYERLILVENAPCTAAALQTGTITTLDWERSVLERLPAEEFARRCAGWIEVG
jgi:hypothetical protein